MAQPDEQDNASKHVKFYTTLQESLVCPIKWHPGRDFTLKRSLHSVPYLRTIMIFPGESLSSSNSYPETEIFSSSPELGENICICMFIGWSVIAQYEVTI